MSESISSFENELMRYGKLVYRSRGQSMMPMLHEDRDLIIVAPRPDGRCRKYDVVLYKRQDQYILHRIMKVLPGGYETCGDHNWRKDAFVKEEQVLGVLTSFVHDGKEISSDSFLYRCYIHLWCDLFPVRVLLLKGKERLRKIKEKL